MISKNYKFEKKWRKRKVKEYSKGIYVKFKPEEVEILHNRMRDLEKVCIQPKYNYCTGEERFTFIKLPKCLVEDEGFVELSMDAKLLYAFFLDRVSLSIKNGWIDNQGRVFIYYSIKNICEDLNCGTQKACKLLDELEKVGALERKRQGLGRPNKLYLKKMF